MNQNRQKPIIGILGGIGSGKSTVATEFVKLGCKAINADAIAHEIIKEPDIKAMIAEKFGIAILDSQGQIDRHCLSKLAFSDESKLCLLNSIVHPPVLVRCEELILEYNRQPEVKAIVLDMPLLVEVGWHKRCDRTVFVRCDYQTRLKRLQKKGNFDENKLKIRENFQISLDIKASMSDIIVDNNSSLLELSQQVEKIFIDVLGM